MKICVVCNNPAKPLYMDFKTCKGCTTGEDTLQTYSVLVETIGKERLQLRHIKATSEVEALQKSRNDIQFRVIKRFVTLTGDGAIHPLTFILPLEVIHMSGIDAMLFNEELHEQALARATREHRAYSIYKDAYFYNARMQPIRKNWNNATIYA